MCIAPSMNVPAPPAPPKMPTPPTVPHTGASRLRNVKARGLTESGKQRRTGKKALMVDLKPSGNTGGGYA